MNTIIPERKCRWCEDEGSEQAIRLHEDEHRGGCITWLRRLAAAGYCCVTHARADKWRRLALAMWGLGAWAWGARVLTSLVYWY